MPPPTTAVLFSASTPVPPPGLQNTVPQTDGAQPAQKVSQYMPPATATLAGAVRADGATLQTDVNGVMSVIAPGAGGTGPSVSGGAYVDIVPTGAKDGSNTQYTLPAPVLAGTTPIYVRNGVTQRQLGTKAEFAVQGTQLTVLYPLQSDDWHEFYYVQGAPNSETGGGGSVTPVPLALRGTSTGAGATGSSFTVNFPTGTQVGDLVVVVCNDDWNLTAPSGWTNQDLHNGVTWNAMTLSKVMTSGDIATGSVTISASGSGDWTYIAAAFIGPTSGIREVDVISMYGGASPAVVTTSSAVQATDMALYFATLRQAGSTASISRGTAVTAITGANSQAYLNTESLTSAGAFSTNFGFTLGGGGMYFVVVIVKS